MDIEEAKKQVRWLLNRNFIKDDQRYIRIILSELERLQQENEELRRGQQSLINKRGHIL